METTIGMLVSEIDVDTDVLGTFAGEIERMNSPLKTAVQKARLGLQASGERLGIASEGSIGVDSMLPLMVDEEIVVFVNTEDDYEVWESFRSYDIIASSICVKEMNQLEDFLLRVDFPHHGLIVRPSDKSHRIVRKGIHDVEILKKSVKEISMVSADAQVIVETDLRAHHCPSRRLNIEIAATKLASRLKELCPSCGTPGWGVVRMNRGLPCDWCAMETNQIREKVFGCALCEHESTQSNSDAQTADPQWCERCNP